MRIITTICYLGLLLILLLSHRNLDLKIARLDEPVIRRLPLALLIARLQVASERKVKVANEHGNELGYFE